MLNEWIDNPDSHYRKMPKEAHRYRKIDVVTEFGIWEEQNPVMCFIGPAIIFKWRPSATEFQKEMFDVKAR